MPSKLAENILIENLLSLNAVAFLTEEPLRLKSGDRKSTRLNSSHTQRSRMPSSA